MKERIVFETAHPHNRHKQAQLHGEAEKFGQPLPIENAGFQPRQQTAAGREVRQRAKCGDRKTDPVQPIFQGRICTEETGEADEIGSPNACEQRDAGDEDINRQRLERSNVCGRKLLRRNFGRNFIQCVQRLCGGSIRLVD